MEKLLLELQFQTEISTYLSIAYFAVIFKTTKFGSHANKENLLHTYSYSSISSNQIHFLTKEFSPQADHVHGNI